MQKEMKVPIVYITDDNYVMPTVVSILSLFENFKNYSKTAEIYVIGVNLSKENAERLKKYNDIQVLNFDNKYGNLQAQHNYITKAALFKFDIAEIFKEYDKVLYLDCDTLILRSLGKLLKTNVDGYYAAVVKDIFAVLKCDSYDIGVGKNYFNSGMMLLNIKKMREDGLERERLLDAKLNETVKKYMDQNVFNTIFANCVKFLHPNYNYLVTNTLLTHFTICTFFNILRIHPVIAHFTYLKPWVYKDVKFSEEWMKCYNLSEYKDVPLNLQEYPHKFSKIYYKRKLYDRWIIDILGLRFSYKKGGKDFRLFYP